MARIKRAMTLFVLSQMSLVMARLVRAIHVFFFAAESSPQTTKRRAPLPGALTAFRTVDENRQDADC